MHYRIAYFRDPRQRRCQLSVRRIRIWAERSWLVHERLERATSTNAEDFTVTGKATQQGWLRIALQ